MVRITELSKRVQLAHILLFAVVYTGAGFVPLLWHQTCKKAESSGGPGSKDRDLRTGRQGNHAANPLATVLTALQL